jgi:hypothetical protein
VIDGERVGIDLVIEIVGETMGRVAYLIDLYVTAAIAAADAASLIACVDTISRSEPGDLTGNLIVGELISQLG